MDLIEGGREAFQRNDWVHAYERLSAAEQQAALEPSDLELLSIAADMIGKDQEAFSIMERLANAFQESGDFEHAARTAFWLGMNLMQSGEFAQGGGWLARAARFIEGRDCVEQGFLLLPAAIQALGSGDLDSAIDGFGQAVSIGERFREPTLTALARHGEGRAHIRKGDAAKGVSLLDEAMVEATSQEVYPPAVGIVYCSVIDACLEIFDIRRAQEWTEVLNRWSGSQPDLVPFRGQCLVFRAEFKQLHGDWNEALTESATAAERLSRPPPHAAAGAAFYQEAEVLRLRGEFADAEKQYENAKQHGHSLHPGLALMRLAQGRLDAAEGAIRRELEEVSDRSQRCRVLPAFVEIVLAAGDVPAARAAADDLESLARALQAPLLLASSNLTTGSVFLEEGEPRSALVHLRKALDAWREIGAPYEAARTEVLIGLACRQMGDDDTADLELKSARSAFEQLGARPALAKLDELTEGKAPAAGLTGREVEVLTLLATGMTNRDVSRELSISEKTVARHVANIFVKIGVTSRAAATAYAYKHQLL